jgi:hypothetical protein
MHINTGRSDRLGWEVKHGYNFLLIWAANGLRLLVCTKKGRTCSNQKAFPLVTLFLCASAWLFLAQS